MNKPQAGSKQGLIDNKDNNNLSPEEQIVNALLLQDVLPELAKKLYGVSHGSVSVEIVIHDKQYRLNFNQKESIIPGKPMSGSTVSSVPLHRQGEGDPCITMNYSDDRSGMSGRYEK